MAKDKLYLQIANFLKGKIASGELKIGDAIYSENLLCERFNVSRTSVRKAVRLMIEENLLVSHQGKGTFIKGPGSGILHNAICLVNHWSRALRLDLIDHYYTDIIYSTENAVREHDMEFQIFTRVGHTPDELIHLMSKLKFDGLVIDGNYQDYFEDLGFFRQIAPSVVVVDGNPEETQLPVVSPDVESGFRTLLQNAAEQGGPLFFVYHEHQVLHRWRLAGFRKAADSLGMEVTYINYGQNISYDNFHSIGPFRVDHHPLIFRALESHLTPKALGGTFFCSCDYTAVKVLHVLHKRGYEVPKDFKLTGFGGFGFSGIADPGITTVKVDSGKLAELAVASLWDHMHGRASLAERVRLLPVGILERDSFPIKHNN